MLFPTQNAPKRARSWLWRGRMDYSVFGLRVGDLRSLVRVPPVISYCEEVLWYMTPMTRLSLSTGIILNFEVWTYILKKAPNELRIDAAGVEKHETDGSVCRRTSSPSFGGPVPVELSRTPRTGLSPASKACPECSEGMIYQDTSTRC
jgi:hypothetical protein